MFIYLKKLGTKMGTIWIVAATVLIFSGAVTSALAQTDWTKHPDNPVLDLGAPEEWDDSKVNPGTVINDGGTYKLWYSGWDGTSGKNTKIGYATSPDGINWTKYAGNPVLDLGDPDEWDDINVAQPEVIKDGSIYKMWYSGGDGFNGRIGYATSPDGINWTKYAGNPVLSQGSGGSWDSRYSFWCAVIKDNLTYKMWYSGAQTFPYYKIGYATSPDGINWTKYAGNPVLDLGDPDEWDDDRVWFPFVLKESSTYLMWFTGSDGSNNCIGYATSPDGINWTKYAGNPVLDVGDPDEWDDEDAMLPAVTKDEGIYKMWYSGIDGSNGRIGYATSGEPPFAIDIKAQGNSVTGGAFYCRPMAPFRYLVFRRHCLTCHRYHFLIYRFLRVGSSSFSM
jgi:predicted GH43/DUF377 family glycosyl hydrolase